jgi:hypothetical protein
MVISIILTAACSLGNLKARNALRARALLARAVAAKAFFAGAAGDRGPGRVTKKM